MYLYPGFREELLKLRLEEIERRARFNAADEVTRSLRAEHAPGQVRIAVAKRLFRAAYAVAGDDAAASLLAFRDEGCATC